MYKYTPYTHSRINAYKNCARSFYYSKVINLPKEFKPSVALDRGTLIHLIFEHNRDLVNIKKTRDFKKIINRKLLDKSAIKECFDIYDEFMESGTAKSLFKREQMFSELSIGLDDKLELAPFDGDNTLLRGYIDAVFIDKPTDSVIVCDWKTGRYKDTQDFSQLLWYSIALFSQIPPEVTNRIVMTYAYVEHQKQNIKILYRKDIEKYKKALFDTIDIIEADTIWEKNETGLCNYCQFQEYCMKDKL